MGTPYTELYESVLSKIKDYDFLNLEESEIYEVLSDYLRPAVAAFRGCRQDLSQRNKVKFKCKLTDTEIEILSNYMVINYLDSNYIRVPLMLKQTLSSKDFNAFPLYPAIPSGMWLFLRTLAASCISWSHI